MTTIYVIIRHGDYKSETLYYGYKSKEDAEKVLSVLQEAALRGASFEIKEILVQ